MRKEAIAGATTNSQIHKYCGTCLVYHTCNTKLNKNRCKETTHHLSQCILAYTQLEEEYKTHPEAAMGMKCSGLHFLSLGIYIMTVVCIWKDEKGWT